MTADFFLICENPLYLCHPAHPLPPENPYSERKGSLQERPKHVYLL
jgi:hypothetical protein